MSTDLDLVIDESNFGQYFFDVKTHRPKPGQVLACYETAGELIDGQLKWDMIDLLVNTESAGESAPRMLQRVAGAKEEDAMRVVREMADDLLNGLSPAEVAAKPYKFDMQFFYYTEKKYIPDGDPHWWSAALIDTTRPDFNE